MSAGACGSHTSPKALALRACAYENLSGPGDPDVPVVTRRHDLLAAQAAARRAAVADPRWSPLSDDLNSLVSYESANAFAPLAYAGHNGGLPSDCANAGTPP